MHTKESLENQFNIKLTFLCFESLVRSLPLKIRTHKITKRPGPQIPWLILRVSGVNNFNRFAYNSYVSNLSVSTKRSMERIKEKWMRDTGKFCKNSFMDILSATASTRLRFFHFKIVNRITSTNVFLNKIGIIDNDNCSFCKIEQETIVHLFWECPNVQEFIQQINPMLVLNSSERRTNVERCSIPINSESWFFLSDLSSIQILIISLAKLVIHEARMKENLPSVVQLKYKIQMEAEIEKYRSKQVGKTISFEDKWKCLRHLLTPDT